MKDWRTYLIAALSLALGAVFTLAAAPTAAPKDDGLRVQSIAPLDTTGNGSARGIWIVANNGTVKYCTATAGHLYGPLPVPDCSPWSSVNATGWVTH